MAYDISRRSINLPSALMLDEDDVDRVCAAFRDILRQARRGGRLMKAVILAGGRGTRISEESQSRPKPMVEIGGQPILWHIMKIYGAAGINDFVVLLGYKGYMIKEYFANYFLHMSDVTIDLANDTVEVLSRTAEPWKVTLLDTGAGDDDRRSPAAGAATTSATRLLLHLRRRRRRPRRREGRSTATRATTRSLTVTAVQPPGRYGTLTIGRRRRAQFEEKPHGSSGWVNGGFFVASPKVLDYIDDDDTVFERAPLERLSQDGELSAYQHHGFWHGMDTLWDKIYLERLWDDNAARGRSGPNDADRRADLPILRRRARPSRSATSACRRWPTPT